MTSSRVRVSSLCDRIGRAGTAGAAPSAGPLTEAPRRAAAPRRRPRRRAPRAATARASAMLIARSAALTSGTSGGAMLSSRTPSPASSTAAAGSPGQLTADPDPASVGLGAVDRLAHEPKQRGLRTRQQRRHVLVPALGGHHVLGQVVGADREEVYVPCQPLGQQRGGRNLDHDAGLHRGVDAGLRPCAREQLERLLELGRGRDHREHQLQRVLGGHPQGGAQLRQRAAPAAPATAGSRGGPGTGSPRAPSAARAAACRRRRRASGRSAGARRALPRSRRCGAPARPRRAGSAGRGT